MGMDIPPWATKQLRALSPGDTASGPIYPHGAEAAARASVNPSADPELVSPTWSSAEVSVAAMPMASTPSIATTIAVLSEVPGVESVEVNVQAHLMRKKKFSSAARTLQEVVNIAAMCPVVKPKNGPDTDTGKYSESPPYGVRMVQADHPEMVMVSKEYAHKVIFCVIDTGLDRKNGEFSTSREYLSWVGLYPAHSCCCVVCSACQLIPGGTDCYKWILLRTAIKHTASRTVVTTASAVFLAVPDWRCDKLNHAMQLALLTLQTRVL
jgi:copper chaperone CopZ